MDPIGLTVLTFVGKKTDTKGLSFYIIKLFAIYIFICIKLAGKMAGQNPWVSWGVILAKQF